MTLLQMSIQAGILIIGIVLIRALGMNKLPKKKFSNFMGYRADKTSRSIVFSCEMEYPYFF